MNSQEHDSISWQNAVPKYIILYTRTTGEMFRLPMRAFLGGNLMPI